MSEKTTADHLADAEQAISEVLHSPISNVSVSNALVTLLGAVNALAAQLNPPA